MRVQRKIFIVDDDEDDRMLMSDAIRNFLGEIDIMEITGGVEMAALLDDSRVKEIENRLVLIDMNMPRLNGLELLHLLKENEDWRAVPVIMLSTTTNPQLINKAYDLGVNAFMVKPVAVVEFEWIAQMINFCFLDNLITGELPPVRKTPLWRSVLVIEDNDDHWKLMEMAVKQTIPSVNLERITGETMLTELLNRYRNDPGKQHDLILMDLYLPDRQDGLSSLRRIRQFIAEHQLPNIPIIVFSYSSHPEDVNDVLRDQANAYLVKPPDVSLWSSYLENLCNVWSNAVSFPKSY